MSLRKKTGVIWSFFGRSLIKKFIRRMGLLFV